MTAPTGVHATTHVPQKVFRARSYPQKRTPRGAPLAHAPAPDIDTSKCPADCAAWLKRTIAAKFGKR